MSGSGSGNIIRVLTGLKITYGSFRRPRSIAAPTITDCVDAPEDCCGSGSGSGSGGDPPLPPLPPPPYPPPSPPVTVACCPDPISGILTATVSNRTGELTQLPDTIYFVSDGINTWFSIPVMISGCTGACPGPGEFSLALQCLGPDCNFQLANASIGSGVMSSCSCAPFAVVFAFAGSNTLCCVGTANFAIVGP